MTDSQQAQQKAHVSRNILLILTSSSESKVGAVKLGDPLGGEGSAHHCTEG